MKAFTTSTTIRATPERIWSILIDAPNYPQGDPWVERIDGMVGPGQRIKAFTKLSPGRAFPVVGNGVRAERATDLEWRDTVWIVQGRAQL